jgi:hypothetical protein
MALPIPVPVRAGDLAAGVDRKRPSRVREVERDELAPPHKATVIHEGDAAGHYGAVTADDFTPVVDPKGESPRGVG